MAGQQRGTCAAARICFAIMILLEFGVDEIQCSLIAEAELDSESGSLFQGQGRGRERGSEAGRERKGRPSWRWCRWAGEGKRCGLGSSCGRTPECRKVRTATLCSERREAVLGWR